MKVWIIYHLRCRNFDTLQTFCLHENNDMYLQYKANKYKWVVRDSFMVLLKDYIYAEYIVIIMYNVHIIGFI